MLDHGVNDTKALAEIQRLARLNRIVYTGHAILRMDDRGASRDDVRSALITATSARPQERGTWRVGGGQDLDGDDLTAIIDIEADVIVVTLF
jgi:hypothetical protein